MNGQQTAKPTLTRWPGLHERLWAAGGRGAGGRRQRADRTPRLPVSLRPTCTACPRGRKAQWRALDREQGGPGSGPGSATGHRDLWQVPAPHQASVSPFVDRRGLDCNGLEDGKSCLVAKSCPTLSDPMD